MYEKSVHKAAFQSASLPGCMVCHSNHGLGHPTDAKLGTGSEAVCTQCHTPGDAGDQARAAMLRGLTQLDDAITKAHGVLEIAESSGMEVSQARLADDEDCPVARGCTPGATQDVDQFVIRHIISLVG